MINYNQYEYSKAEKLAYGLVSMAGGFGVLWLFYDSLPVSFVGSLCFSVGFLMYYRRVRAKQRRWQLTIQFKDAMESVVSALVAGYSLENAIVEARKDLTLMYEPDAIILREFDSMIHKLEVNVSVEMLIQDLGKRSGVEDIQTFGEILSTAKKTGGNIAQVMRRTAANIGDKIEIKREIDTLIAGKRMEAACMTAIPLLMIVYLRVFSPGFLDPLYQGLAGVLFMTVALIVYIFSFLWGQKIMEITF